VEGVYEKAYFSLTNKAGAAASIHPISGIPLHVIVGRALGTPLAATVLDTYSNPVPGVNVIFSVVSGGPAGGSFGGSGSASAFTDGSGMAAAGGFIANSNLGSYEIQASTPGVSDPAVFALTNISSLQTTESRPPRRP
jgi:hypothetical protein